MDMNVLREWLIQNGISEEELDSVQPNPLLLQIQSMEEKSATADEKYNALNKEAVSVEDLKMAKIAQLKEACTLSIYDGFESDYGSFGFNEHDQANFTQQLLVVVADRDNLIKNIEWKSRDKGVVSLSKAEFLHVIDKAKENKVTQQKKYWKKEEEVLYCESKDEVESINWN